MWLWLLIVLAVLLAHAGDGHWLDVRRLPGEVWSGLGVTLLGIVWGLSFDARPSSGPDTALPAGVVFAALLSGVTASLVRARRSTPDTTRVPMLTWFALGLMPAAFLVAPLSQAPPSMRAPGIRILEIAFAIALIGVGLARSRDRRKADPGRP